MSTVVGHGVGGSVRKLAGAGLGPYGPVLFTVTMVWLWVAGTAAVQPAQFADSIEQYNWAHGVQWGYWKHPPLPTWLMAAMIQVIGAGAYTAYALAALCFAGTAFFTWKAARELMAPQAAAAAMVLWSLHLGFSWRAQIYNHNTVLLMMVSLLAWLVLAAARNQRLGWWTGAGLAAGGAFLAKYQAAVPMAGMLFALWYSGALQQRANRRGLAVAAVVALAVVLPHMVWAVSNHMPSYQYFRQSAPVLEPMQRPLRWLAVAANQLRLHFPMLAALALMVLFARRQPPPDAPLPGGESAGVPVAAAWFWGLIGVPVLALSGLILVVGVHAQSQWGLQTFQFMPLLIVWQLQRMGQRFDLQSLMIAALVVHAAGSLLYSRSLHQIKQHHSRSSTDRLFPAHQLAERALADWNAATTCPLRYVVGPSFEAGLVSVYSGLYPTVQEDGDPVKSPWVDPQDLARSGALVVSINHLAPGEHAQAAAQSMLAPSRRHGQGAEQVSWTVRPPQTPCPS